jgi:hypothetical protein
MPGHVISRREIVLGGAAAAVFDLASPSNGALAQVASPGKFEIVKSDEEWRRELTSEQYAVLRRRETERKSAQQGIPAGHLSLR